VSVASPPAVIIPSFNGAAALGATLESLRRQTVEHEVVVVDNASSDGTGRLLADRFPEVRVVALAENVGFGRALNIGVQACRAETLVFLNNDVACEPGFVERLCASLDPSHGIVMAAGVLVEWDAPERIDSAGVVFDRTLFALDYLRGLPTDVLERGVADPFGPTGGAAAFHRPAFAAVGGFDEQFFAYLEDVDLVARLLARGGRCRLAQNARARHRRSATLGAGSRRKNELMGWSRGYTVAKYRLHRHPGRLVRTLLAESTIALGQLVVDRTAVSLTARVRGFRAGLRVQSEVVAPLPPASARVTLRGGLSQRARQGAAGRLAAPKR
jgi:GT2 family glycosyltransferase